MTTTLISRYPGVVPFSEQQADLFRGRDKEKAELYNLVVAEQTIVLFAKSGVGKSSLLQAGLFPKLRKNGFHPIKVRFQYTSAADENDKEQVVKRKTPLEILFETLEQRSQAEDDHVVIKREKILFNKDNPRLWELIKVIELPDVAVIAEPVVQQTAVAEAAAAPVLQAEEEDEEVKKISSMLGQFIPSSEQRSTVKQTPVLVFDQFEEFFNFPEPERNEFMMQLREVLHNLTPNRIGQWLRGFELSNRTPERLEWAKQPVVKCIISIRDDKLSELDSLRNYIPLILRNRYKLSALTPQNAAEAMEIPAGIEDEKRFRSPAFKFETTTRDKILVRLTGADIDDRPVFPQAAATPTYADETPAAEKGIDGSQLQKVCSYIENKVIVEFNRTKKPVEVNKAFINPDIEVQNILDNFYEEQLKKIGSARDIIRCRNIIEQHLVSGRSRASVTRSQMKDLLKGRNELLEKMINARLIKEEYTHLGQTFELSHDSLIRSVARYASQNRLKILNRDKKLYIWAFAVSGLLFIIALILGLRIFGVLNQNNLKLAESYYQQNNHYTAFNIWDKFRNRMLVSPGKKDSINRMLDSLSLFDIAGGDKLVRLSDWAMAVHEKDNTIHLWKIPGNGGRLQVKTILDAYNLETSHSKRYMGYRTKNGTLMIYDLRNDSLFPIPYADIAPMDGRRGTNVDADYKMGFLNGADFVGYIDSSGQIYIYNLDSRARIRLRIRKDDDKDFYSAFLQSRMKISEDKTVAIVHKSDSFTIWNIANPNALPVRRGSVKGVTATYFSAKGNSYCYQKKDSLFVTPFDNLGTGRPYRTRILSTPSFSPDGKYCIFYNGDADLVIFNMMKNTVAAVLREGNYDMADYSGKTYYSTSRRRMQSVFLTEPEWVDEGDKVYYQDKKHNNILFSVSQLRPIQDLSVYSSDGQFFCRVKGSGELKVYDRKSGAVLFTDTIRTDSITAMNVAFQYARFSSAGTLLAYQMSSANSEGYLKVVDFKSGAVKYRSRRLWSIGDFFTKDFIAVYDELGNPGLLFMNGRTRNEKYYQDLYPRLEEAEKDRLGVRDFRDIINVFKPI